MNSIVILWIWFLACNILIGANSFGFYAVKIFRQTFAGSMNPHGGAIAVGFVQLLAAMLSGLLIDTVGRIPLLIISSVFMSLALASFGSYVYYEQANKMVAVRNFDMDAAASVNTDWIPLLCVLVFTIAFSLGKLFLLLLHWSISYWPNKKKKNRLCFFSSIYFLLLVKKRLTTIETKLGALQQTTWKALN